MIGRSSSFLGLAFAADQTIACAEVSIAGGRATVSHAATFAFPDGASLDASGPAGQALAGFLRQKGFGSSRAVVGVPARWMVAFEKELPPADAVMAQSALRLQAERLAVAESGDMIFDYAGAPQRSAASKVLLVGMHKSQLEKIRKTLDAAGLTIVAVTSSGLALSAAADGEGDGHGDGGILTIGRSGGEIVWRQDGSPRMLRHVPVAANGQDMPLITSMAGELRRIVAMTGTNGVNGSRSLLVIDPVRMDAQQLGDVSARLGITVKLKTPREALGVESSDAGAGDVTAAIALGLAAAKQQLPFDFEHSRLTVAAPKRFGRGAILAAVIAGALVLLTAWLLVASSQKQSKVDALTKQLSDRADETSAAKAAIERLNTGRTYFSAGRLSAIDCLREVTLAFRSDEKIWATSFSIRDNGKCVLSGKSGDQKTVLRLLEGLKQTGKFSDVKLIDMRQADNRGTEESFSIGFTYSGVG